MKILIRIVQSEKLCGSSNMLKKLQKETHICIKNMLIFMLGFIKYLVDLSLHAYFFFNI